MVIPDKRFREFEPCYYATTGQYCDSSKCHWIPAKMVSYESYHEKGGWRCLVSVAPEWKSNTNSDNSNRYCWESQLRTIKAHIAALRMEADELEKVNQ